ncbi:MAG: hypothetical protein KDB53_18545 [Planctomycetes bacterium]|nr:hypothetical protein [Planctomycetota bacterium]
MVRHAIILVLTFAVAGCASPAPEAPASANDVAQGAPATTTEAAIVETVHHALYRGHVLHDYLAWESLWASRVRVVWDRRITPGPTEQMLGRREHLAAHRILFSAPPDPGAAFLLEVQVLDLDPQETEATLLCETTRRFSGGEETRGEVFSLRKRGDRWQVIENRWWPIAGTSDEGNWRWTDEAWQTVDAGLSRLAEGDALRYSRALFGAHRYFDAVEAARRAAEGHASDAETQAWLGHCEAHVGAALAAHQAFSRARELDPSVALPPYALR